MKQEPKEEAHNDLSHDEDDMEDEVDHSKHNYCLSRGVHKLQNSEHQNEAKRCKSNLLLLLPPFACSETEA